MDAKTVNISLTFLMYNTVEVQKSFGLLPKQKEISPLPYATLPDVLENSIEVDATIGSVFGLSAHFILLSSIYFEVFSFGSF